MDITKLSVESLKALAYDQIAERDRVQTNLNLINQEIANRGKAEPIKEEKK